MLQLIFLQTVKLSFRKGGGALGACAFYIIVTTMFTFALGPEAASRYSTAILSVALLLSTITTLPLLFERDYEDGTLEQYLLQPTMLECIILAKLCGAWVAQLLPMLLISPLLALMSGIPIESMSDNMLLLTLASPSLIALGAIGAALTLGAKRGGLLQALIVMPLTIPILIFTASGGEGAVFFLAGILCASLPLSVIVCAALMRAGVD